jgi:hypothetical protein
MATPLKVSDGLYALARQEAAAANRSITNQVEYWAKIGRAAEALLAHDELRTLTQAGEQLIPMFPSDTRRTEIHALLLDIASGAAREAVSDKLKTAGKAVYATDPAHPNMVIQVAPDGTRTPGHLQNRKFVPGPKLSR